MTPLIVVAGVSGAGKTTVGSALAARLGTAFVDADALHPEANVAKMASATPLTDEDRWPWLAIVGETLAAGADSGMVVACSALRRAYRDVIRTAAPTAAFALLEADPAVLAHRVDPRPGHFMPPSLLASQLEILEPLAPKERGVTVRSMGGGTAVAKPSPRCSTSRKATI